MKRNSTSIAVALLAILFAAGALPVAGANGPQAAIKASAAADTPFIAFMKKVLAAAPDEFEAFRGEEKTGEWIKKNTQFHGTLRPSADSDCTLHPRSGEELDKPPLYSCELHAAQRYAEAKALFDKTVAELRAAFPDWEIEGKRVGKESERPENWTALATRPGFTVRLTLIDWEYLTEKLSGKPADKPGVEVTLSVTDTAREKEKPKTAAAKEMTASLPICRFVEKVRAANKDNFAAIRSLKPVEASGAYAGTLRPEAQSKCRVFPGAKDSGNGRSYSCELRRAETLAELQPEYDRLKTELQGCYSNLRFKEETRDKDKNPEDSMYFTGSYFTGRNTLWEISVHSRDDSSTVKALAEKTGTDPKLAPKLLRLSVTILQ